MDRNLPRTDSWAQRLHTQYSHILKLMVEHLGKALAGLVIVTLLALQVLLVISDAQHAHSVDSGSPGIDTTEMHPHFHAGSSTVDILDHVDDSIGTSRFITVGMIGVLGSIGVAVLVTIGVMACIVNMANPRRNWTARQRLSGRKRLAMARQKARYPYSVKMPRFMGTAMPRSFELSIRQYWTDASSNSLIPYEQRAVVSRTGSVMMYLELTNPVANINNTANHNIDVYPGLKEVAKLYGNFFVKKFKMSWVSDAIPTNGHTIFYTFSLHSTLPDVDNPGTPVPIWDLTQQCFEHRLQTKRFITKKVNPGTSTGGTWLSRKSLSFSCNPHTLWRAYNVKGDPDSFYGSVSEADPPALTSPTNRTYLVINKDNALKSAVPPREDCDLWLQYDLVFFDTRQDI